MWIVAGKALWMAFEIRSGVEQWTMERNTQGRWQYMREAGELAVIGLTLVFSTAIGYFLGHQVELAWPEWKPWGGVVGAMLGVVAGFLEMARTLRRLNRKIEAAERERDGAKH